LISQLGADDLERSQVRDETQSNRAPAIDHDPHPADGFAVGVQRRDVHGLAVIALENEHSMLSIDANRSRIREIRNGGKRLDPPRGIRFPRDAEPTAFEQRSSTADPQCGCAET